MGTRWGENNPEDHVRYARIDLMGLVREDLLFDMARHVDSTVHQFEEWGLPIMKDPKTGRYLREGRWQIMIHGESYKPIVAEAAKKSADKVFNRICVTHLLMDDARENRVAGAVGFNVRTGNYHVFKSKTVICGAGGASNIFKPRSVGEGSGRTWYAPWSSASAYGLMIDAGAKMTQMENRIVLARFKDGYGPVGAYFLHLKTYTQNCLGEEYESKWFPALQKMVGKEYLDPEVSHLTHRPIPTCLRNHCIISEVNAGPRPDSHGDHARVPGSSSGGGRLGKLPRHDRRPGGSVGRDRCRSQERESRADDVRTLRHGLARDLFGRVVLGPEDFLLPSISGATTA
jgi:adenylylsulfate reductase subunit A